MKMAAEKRLRVLTSQVASKSLLPVINIHGRKRKIVLPVPYTVIVDIAATSKAHFTHLRE